MYTSFLNATGSRHHRWTRNDTSKVVEVNCQCRSESRRLQGRPAFRPVSLSIRVCPALVARRSGNTRLTLLLFHARDRPGNTVRPYIGFNTIPLHEGAGSRLTKISHVS